MASSIRVACIVGQGFEDSEFRKPFDRFQAEGFRVDLIGAKAGEELEGKRGKESIQTDKGIDDCDPGEYAALFIPGGHSPDVLRADQRFIDFVKAFDQAKKPIFAVCHGPQLFLSADLVEGRTLTAWRTVQKDLELAGANVRDEEVVVDRNWVTSRQPQDLDAFCDASVRMLQGGLGRSAGYGEQPQA